MLQKLKQSKTHDDIAQLWYEFFTLYQETFASLPGFESAFFDGERIDNLLKIICMEFAVDGPKLSDSEKN